ncbi:hypothetical protein DERP_013540 [Dermatophagoides pteronyssinus]|uniref:Tumor susceptibility gene 101 protein-like n=1 Tax=Dermatophagoides pteronyssinus TaxID=6956 RepID=A0ABQ8IXP4_DERPT|nr:hypothetical protein DERP_013540 [Dermatophagoides pteronyssinus]
MSTESFQIARLLSQAKYRFQDQAKRQITDVLKMYRNLFAYPQKCTLPNGIKRDLVVLRGTIPITYRKNVYNIPVSIWVLEDHPDSAPICWVNPTKDMTIKVSEHVDQDGRVYLPYLSNWDRNASDLLGVIQVMIIIFGDMPPLYSKPKTTETPGYPQSGTANPPYPTRFPGQYPFSNVYPAVQPVQPTTSSYPPPSSNPSDTPSYPAYPMMPMPYGQSTNQPTTGGNSLSSSSTDTNTITKEHIRLSLLSAVEDKIKARSKEMLSQYKAEIDVLKRTNDDLKKGRTKLDDLVKDIETNLVELSKCKEKIQAKDSKISELVAKMESSENQLNIDEYFGPVQPLYKQLFNAFAEENAIIDTIFYLNEALQKNVIELDVFIKHVRELSRRQFMLRALVKVCREKAGLPT